MLEIGDGDYDMCDVQLSDHFGTTLRQFWDNYSERYDGGDKGCEPIKQL